MSFYNDASLIMLPSAGAGKDGKAYSVKPTDGTGDFTFSRGSNLAATRVNASGLIEKGRENLLTYSNDFSNAAWNKSKLSVTGGQTGYDGGSDAWKLVPNTDNSGHYISQSASIAGVFTISFYAKANGYNGLLMYNSGNPSFGRYFDLVNGVINYYVGSGVDATMTDVGDGWYRCTLTNNQPSSGGLAIYISDNGTNNISFAGDGTSGVLIQSAQVEIGLAATDYIESGASTGKAGLLENEPRFDYSGGATCPSLLLEPSRTQLIPYSEYLGGWGGSITQTNTTTLNREGRLVNSFYSRIVSQTISVDSNQTYSLSAYAKKDTWNWIYIRTAGFDAAEYTWFDLENGIVGTAAAGHGTPTITPEGNGWYRCTIYFSSITDLTGNAYLSGVPSNGSTTQGSNDQEAVFIDMIQCEKGSYPTSYIPNHSGGSVTRGADTAIASNAASLLSESEGTLYLEVKSFPDSQSLFTISDGGISNRIGFYYQYGVDLRCNIRINNTQTNISGGGNISDAFHKIALTYKAELLKMFVDGVLINSASYSGSITSALNTIDFAQGDGNSNALGEYKQTLVFQTALSDADCISLTTL